ncbi:hypothetical protein LCGC14_2767960 [marine sediment metagenome]|uniref:Uncharacterized protein n=1 Tax=marine sediment metagenome TaxID=412755 RepID=A0A0F8YWZ5_9ZZZZ
MVYLTREQTELAQQLCNELPAIADRLGRAGLFETMHAMYNGPISKIGYELAERACWNNPKNQKDEEEDGSADAKPILTGLQDLKNLMKDVDKEGLENLSK